ncbi:MAG: putative histidine kinase, atypical hybrid [Ramlibacter sp.]|nr:putative histidine kinase, atypical hybrid [Ramlibacter sp.]
MTVTSAVKAVSAATDMVNILVVDDEPKNLIVLETVLDDPSYHLIRAMSGEEALLALMANEFAVLVLDVRMPGMTGFELAMMIKERKKTARVPIIFLTAYYNEDQHILEGYGSGAVDYLHKPVNASVLRSKVAVFAELHRKGRALEVANRALMGEVAERRRAEARLSELNQSLDRRVTERTTALEATDAQLREANRRKDEFLATLAHELRNPLAPVRNAIQVLRLKGLASPELQWAAELIDRQIQAMSRLIDDLMDVSRINQGRIELRRQRVELARVLQDAVETTRPFIDECGHELALILPDQSLPLEADPTRLAQAFMNLLNNAAKYTDRGGRIELRVSAQAGEVVVSVKDNGIGLEPARLSAVFEMFSQVESALSRSRGGLGIGLSLAQRLVQMHGGTVEARSAGLGQGSEFSVRLPLVGAVEQLQQTAPDSTASPVAGSAPSAALRILVADDNRDAADTMTMLLEVMGHSVRHVNDGEAAVQAAAEFNPQIVLLDIGMPKLNGYEACRRIRAQEGGAGMIIIAITGWGQPEDRLKSEDAGFDQHLVKPVDPTALAGALAAASRKF